MDFGRNLEESRRSGQSIYSAYDMSSTRRKLVAVKQAPMLPILLAVEEKPENDSQLQTQQPSHRTSSSRLQPLSPDSQAATSEKLIGLNAITPPPQPVATPTAPTAPDLKEAKEAKDSVATYRNEILQLLSMVKLTEILTLTDIVDEASGGTKADCHLAERGLISQSRRML